MLVLALFFVFSLTSTALADEIPGYDIPFPVEEEAEVEVQESESLPVEEIPAAVEEGGYIVYDTENPNELFIPEDQELQLPDLYVHQIIVQPEEDEEPVEEYITILDSRTRSADSIPGLPRLNTVLYRGYFGNRPCFILFPSDAASVLTVVDDVLINVGSSSVTGRLFYDDEFDLEQYSYSLFVLGSIFSNNTATQIYRYGFASYVRYYSYVSGNNLSWSDTYGDFTVEETVPTRSPSTTEDIFYCVLIITLILGMTYIMSWIRVSKNEV